MFDIGIKVVVDILLYNEAVLTIMKDLLSVIENVAYVTYRCCNVVVLGICGSMYLGIMFGIKCIYNFEAYLCAVNILCDNVFCLLFFLYSMFCWKWFALFACFLSVLPWFESIIVFYNFMRFPWLGWC